MRAFLAVLFLCGALSFSAAWGQSRGEELDRRMQQIEAQLDAMDGQMDRIHRTADPAERGELLAAHARAWRAAAAAVRELGRVFTPQMRAMMAGSEEIPSAERMMLAHDLMARRLSIMGHMIQQAVEQVTTGASPREPGKGGN